MLGPLSGIMNAKKNNNKFFSKTRKMKNRNNDRKEKQSM